MKEKDWVKMECLFCDYTEEREFASVNKLDVRNEYGEDISERFFADRNVIRLTNNSGTNVKGFAFFTKEEANRFFKLAYEHRNLTGWRKVN